MREVVAEFDKPVMLYSIGKDSSGDAASGAQGVLPGEAAVPVAACRHHLEVPRDDRVSRRDRGDARARSLVHINQDGVARGINPIASGSSLHTQVMKTEALKQALDLYGFDAAFGGARRDEEKSRAKERIFSFRSARTSLGPAQPAAGTLEALQHPHAPGRDACASFRCRTGPNSTSGNTSMLENIPVVPLYFAKPRPVVERDGTLIMVDDERMPLQPGEKPEMQTSASARSAAIR